VKEKLRNFEAVDLIRPLIYILVFVLLGLMVNTGTNMALGGNSKLKAQSEAQELLDSAAGVLADQLRCARSVELSDGEMESFYSVSGRDSRISVGPDGQLVIGPEAAETAVLPPEAYKDGAYGISGLEIRYDSEQNCFDIALEVKETDGDISANADFSVKCLNIRQS